MRNLIDRIAKLTQLKQKRGIDLCVSALRQIGLAPARGGPASGVNVRASSGQAGPEEVTKGSAASRRSAAHRCAFGHGQSDLDLVVERLDVGEWPAHETSSEGAAGAARQQGFRDAVHDQPPDQKLKVLGSGVGWFLSVVNMGKHFAGRSALSKPQEFGREGCAGAGRLPAS